MPTQTTTEPLPPTIEVDGAAIRARRKELGLTIATLADRANMSLQYVSQLERGDRSRMSPPLFRLLVAALQMRRRENELKADAS